MPDFSPDVPQVPMFLTEADLERAIGKQAIAELFAERSGSTPEQRGLLIQEYLVLGERQAAAYLLGNWGSLDAVATLGRNDPVLRLHCCIVAAEMRCMTKPGFISSEGRGRYAGRAADATAYFTELQKSFARRSGEGAAGAGSNTGGDVQPRIPQTERRFIFAPTGRQGKSQGRF